MPPWRCRARELHAKVGSTTSRLCVPPYSQTISLNGDLPLETTDDSVIGLVERLGVDEIDDARSQVLSRCQCQLRSVIDAAARNRLLTVAAPRFPSNELAGRCQ